MGQNTAAPEQRHRSGCGPGFPITVILVEEGLHVFGVDAAPSFVAAFQRNLPGIPILCEAVQDSRMFDRTFDAVLAWGLMFLLKAEEQIRLIHRFAEMLVPGGPAVHFTCQAHRLERWNDRFGINILGCRAVQDVAQSRWHSGHGGVRGWR